jgi:heptosyltransferase II
MPAEVVFLGTRDEYALVEDIRSLMRNRTSANLAGKIDMLEAMAVMNLSRAVISNDTGSAHLAVAASATVLTIFGPTTPGATAPFGDRSHIIQGEAPCAPCRHYRCPLPQQPCMRTVTPEDVLNRMQTIVD